MKWASQIVDGVGWGREVVVEVSVGSGDHHIPALPHWNNVGHTSFDLLKFQEERGQLFFADMLQMSRNKEKLKGLEHKCWEKQFSFFFSRHTFEITFGEIWDIVFI